MKTCNISKNEIYNFIEYLKNSYQVLGVKKRRKTPVFSEISDSTEIVLEYTTTVLPPKKFFMPPTETLFEFEIETQKIKPQSLSTEKRVLVGVHPCDMAGILRLDRAFMEGQPEANWIERRKATTIFGIAQVPDDQCFSNAVRANDSQNGYDGFFFDNGKNYLLALYTEKGEEALGNFKGAKPAQNGDMERGKQNFENLSSQQSLKLVGPLAEMPTLLNSADKCSEWQDVAGRCLSCGSCTMVCPTCYCFDVEDKVNLTITEGERQRKWDSCQLLGFTTVAGGHSFRSKRENRASHRIYRKFRYLVNEENGEDEHNEKNKKIPFCVGCGRCSRSCTAGISIVEIMNNVCKQTLVGG